MTNIILLVVLIVATVGVVIFMIMREKKILKTPQDADLWIQTTQINTDFLERGLSDITIQEETMQQVKKHLHQTIIGMDNFINALLITLLAKGHLLVEGVPGLAKTKTIHSVANLIAMEFRRIQFTPDMLPADIIGVELFNMQEKKFEMKTGPVFANIILADEINRTTPKVQSALLEAMQEQQVTIGNKTLRLPDPFFVLATQNPLEHEGTYPLPEAQVDRFLFKIIVDYPSLIEEKMIMETIENQHENPQHEKSLMRKEIFHTLQNEIEKVKISDTIKNYIARIVTATRKQNDKILYGASPRGSIGLLFSSKVLAYLQGRDFVTHEDIQRLTLNVLRHRIALSYDAKSDGRTEDKILLEVASSITLN